MTRRRILGAVAMVLLAATIASAQGVSVRFYFVPKIGDGLTRETAFRPKYVDPGELGIGLDIQGAWSGMDYGPESVFLLAIDVTTEQHNALSAQTDVLAVPALDNTVSAVALPTVQAKLEAMNIPSEWVDTGITYRRVLRTVVKIIQFAQRYYGMFHGANDRLFGSGVTLDTQWNQLSPGARARVRAAADSLGLDYSGVTNTMTLRQILRLVGDQLPSVTVRGEGL